MSLNSITSLPEIFDFDSKKTKKAVGPDAEDFSCPFLRSQIVIVPLQQPYKGYSLYECIHLSPAKDVGKNLKQ